MRMKRIIVILLIFFFNSVLIIYSQTNSLCGPKSLLVVFQKLGIKANLNEIIKLSGYEESKGTTMYGLYKAARKKGLYAVGMKIGVEDLTKLKIPAIAHLWDNHFVVVEGTQTETLIITDPPKNPVAISKNNFKSIYSGFALLISKNKRLLPTIETKGPDIRFNTYTYNFGRIEKGSKKKIEYTFKFKNAGKEELKIFKVRTSCGCTAALVSNKIIPPKGKGAIKVSFDATGRDGYQLHKIYIHSNDLITPLIPLQIVGIIKTEPIVIPENIYFGDIKKSELPTTKKIYIIKPEGEKFKIKRVIISSNLISAKVSESTHKYYKGFEVDVNLKQGIPIGQLKEQITFYTNIRKKPKIEIPITANIVGDIEIYPNMLFFGFVREKKDVKREVRIFTTGEQPFKIKEIENKNKFLSLEVKQKGNKEYQLIATLNKKAPNWNLKEEIIIYTDNSIQPKIKIPIYGFIKR